jgi:diadenosine tetraphosphate (Ap4A) HIT family hydrolase
VRETLIHERVAEARAGENRTVLARMRSGWAVLGDRQFLRGYCLLLPDPVVPTLSSLGAEARGRFLMDMSLIGDAILAVTDAVRINYSILGNHVPALHAHVFPRYASEDPEHLTLPVWRYPIELRTSVPFCPERDGPLKDELAKALARLGGCA